MNIEEASKIIGFPGLDHRDQLFFRLQDFAGVVREEALEEAAKKCEELEIEGSLSYGQCCAATIRALKA